jgi:hypothetical protein
MLSLKSAHLFVICAAIVVMGGFGVWGFFNHYALAGAISLLVAVVLIVYLGYFASSAEQI